MILLSLCIEGKVMRNLKTPEFGHLPEQVTEAWEEKLARVWSP